jgi:xylulokinase
MLYYFLCQPQYVPEGDQAMPFILSHDLGTTGNKAILFDGEGSLVASHLASYLVSYPQANWAEQNPDDWWRAVCLATHALLAEAHITPREIAAVTFSGQMMGSVPIDKSGTPLRSAIIWADQRAVAEADTISNQCGLDIVYQRTGHRISPAYVAAKILWIKHHQPDIYQRTHKFLCAKDYIAFKLTGQTATDYSDASGSNVFDLVQRVWSQDLLSAIGLNSDTLPEVHASTDVIGDVTHEAADVTGLAAGTPVVIGGGDGACAAVGAGVIAPGDAYCYIGSSSWISFASDAPVFDPEMRTFTFHHLHPQLFAPMGTMQAAGGARDWLLRQIGEISEDEIGQVAPGANGLLFLPYLLGERSPWWNPKARGAYVGLTMSHSRAEMTRAVLEGVAFNLRMILDALESQGASIPAIRLIGGGAQSLLWQRILANMFARPIQILELVTEATSWGAAVAGGVGVGLYDWGIAREKARVALTVEPDPVTIARYADIYPLFQDTYRGLEPIYARISEP